MTDIIITQDGTVVNWNNITHIYRYEVSPVIYAALLNGDDVTLGEYETEELRDTVFYKTIAAGLATKTEVINLS